jgi:hypothetical protein
MPLDTPQDPLNLELDTLEGRNTTRDTKAVKRDYSRYTKVQTHIRVSRPLVEALQARGYSPRQVFESCATVLIRRHDLRHGVNPDLELYPKRRLTRDKRLVTLEQSNMLETENLVKLEVLKSKVSRLERRRAMLKRDGILR